VTSLVQSPFHSAPVGSVQHLGLSHCGARRHGARLRYPPSVRVVVGVASLLVATACARPPPPPLPVPRRVEWPYPVRVFRGQELEEMRARLRLAGAAYGTGCYCMPIHVVHGSELEATNLRGPNCADASLAPEDSGECTGLDPSGIEQFGRYLCLEWRLGPSEVVPHSGP
jgi:hypothetical protein